MRKFATMLVVMVTLCMVSPIAYAAGDENTSESEIATEDIETTVSDEDGENVIQEEADANTATDAATKFLQVYENVFFVISIVCCCGGLLFFILNMIGKSEDGMRMR